MQLSLFKKTVKYTKTMNKLTTFLGFFLLSSISHEAIASMSINYNCVIRGKVAQYLLVKSKEITEIKNCSFIDTSLMTYFIVHGHKENALNSEVLQIAKTLSEENVNVILVNYKEFAQLSYRECSSDIIAEVGINLGEFIVDSMNSSRLNASKVHIIGYLLGAHLAGQAGRHVFKNAKCKIKQITALQPVASPFHLIPIKLGKGILKKTDAEIVDALHVSYLIRGAQQYGTIDFYVTLPLFGPCLAINFKCHNRLSTKLYLESINSCGLNGEQIGRSQNGTVIYGYHMNSNVTGLYQININNKAPFAKNSTICATN